MRQDLAEERVAVGLDFELAQGDGAAREGVGKRGLGDVHAEPDDHDGAVGAVASLGQNAGELAPVHEHVVGPLDRRCVRRAGEGVDGVGDRQPDGERHQAEAVGRKVAEDDRGEQALALDVGPRPAQATTPARLVVRGEDRAVRRTRLGPRGGLVHRRDDDGLVPVRNAQAHSVASSAPPTDRTRQPIKRRRRSESGTSTSVSSSPSAGYQTPSSGRRRT